MRRLLYSIATMVIICCPLLTFAQWTSHISLHSCTYSAIASDGELAGNSAGFLMHYNDGSLVKFCKSNYLSDTDISALSVDGDMAYVGYSNGNIDIINLTDLTTINIPELKNFVSIEDRCINHICKYAQMLYCSTNCGIVVVNLNKNEILSRYPIDNNKQPIVNATAIVGDKIYAATSVGLFCANLKSNILENSNEWTLCDIVSSNFCAVASFANRIVAAQGSIGQTNQIYTVDGLQLTELAQVESFRNFSTIESELLIVSTYKLSFYDTNMTQTSTMLSTFNTTSGKLSIAMYDAHLSTKGKLAIAEASHGLVVSLRDGNATTYCLNGPYGNNSFALLATHKGVLCSAGGLSTANNNLNRNILVNYYSGKQWSYTMAGQRDALLMASDPNNEDSIYLSTWGNGIFKIENGVLSTHYTTANSALIDIFGGNDYTRTYGIAYNANSTLFVTQSEVSQGLAIKSPDGEWGTLSYPMIDNLHSAKQILFTSNGNGWIIIPRGKYLGLFVFNTNGTDFDYSDDVYRGVATFDDERDCGQLQLWDSDGEVITNTVSAIVEDADNVLWFATDVGVLTFDNDKNIFTTPRPSFGHIKVPRNDGSNLADYLLDGIKVLSIAVDGANRKWLGTLNDGVYLVSADGTETIHHFTDSNSPLPTNEVISIAIDPISGEVFFATSQGLVSYQGDASEAAEKLSDIKVYPNPVRPNYKGEVRMTGFSHNALIKITDVNGRLVYATQSAGGMATWNCVGIDGSRVASGVYIVWANNTDGTEKAVSKILVIR